MFEVEGNEVHGNMPTTPFNGRMEADAWATYKGRWITLMCIWQRVESWEERPPYRMTMKQRGKWSGFVKAVEAVVQGRTGRAGIRTTGWRAIVWS